MSILDSEAVFRSRGGLIGVTDAVLDLFKDAGISTMGKLAFASSYVPGAADDSPFTDLVKKAIKREPTLGELSALRRLFSGSYAATAAEMKSIVVEQTDETPTRRLAPAERSERYESQQKRLTGIKIRGMFEPGGSLVDAADTSLSCDSNGVLKMNRKDHVVPCEVTSELQVKYCLTRRGLALEQGNLFSFENHEKWAEKLFASRLNEPPTGYARVSFRQMQLADAKLFVVLGAKCRSGIKVAAGSNRPCDDKFEEAMNSNDVQHLLQPMPIAQKSRFDVDTPKVQPVKQTIEDTVNKKFLYQRKDTAQAAAKSSGEGAKVGQLLQKFEGKVAKEEEKKPAKIESCSCERCFAQVFHGQTQCDGCGFVLETTKAKKIKIAERPKEELQKLGIKHDFKGDFLRQLTRDQLAGLSVTDAQDRGSTSPEADLLKHAKERVKRALDLGLRIHVHI
eukprot:s972_g16.t1